jgi:hypothetical protein
MSTILAEVPTVGQAIRNIVNHFINPLILLASVFFVGAAMFFHWKEDIARRNLALIILLILLILWIFGEPIFFPMPFHIHKVLDFGTTEPWVARLWLGIFQFRDFVDTGTKRLAFDQKYAPILDNLYECYRAMILLHKTIAEHETKVSSQEIFHVQNGNFMVTENIDTQMSRRRT